MSDPAFKAMSAEEYLRTEEKSPFKREYVGGFVYPLHGQSGVSQEHSKIATNIVIALGREAQHAGCRLHASDMRLYIDARGSYYYPDVMLACQPNPPDKYFETDPCFLVEVLSKSTAGNDRVGKYGMYTAIPTLQTYLIVEQDERRVYLYTRQDGKWPMQELMDGSVPVNCLNMELTLDDIYMGVL